MRIAIIGAGSIGLLLGTFLSEAAFDVTMIVKRKEQKDMIAKEGIRRVNIDQTETIFHVVVTDDLNNLSSFDLIIIAVKFEHIANLLTQLTLKEIDNPLLFIQNGIGHYNMALATTLPNLAFGTIEHGALKTDDRSVLHNGVGYLTLGKARGEESVLKEIEKIQLNGFPVKMHEDVDYILMRKVLINCMINPLTAILQVENGELLTNPHALVLLEELYIELSGAFPMMNSGLSLDDVKAVCDNTKRNRSSMFADRLAGRKMEIETIVSAVIERASHNQKSLSLLTVLEKMLYAIDEKGEI